MATPEHRIRELIEDGTAIGAELVPIVGPVLASVLHVRSDRELRKQVHLLTRTIELLSGRVDVLEAAMKDPELADLVDHAVDVGGRMRTAQQNQLEGLARIVSQGLSSRTTNQDRDTLHNLIDVIGQLQPDHVVVLDEIATVRNVNGDIIVKHDTVSGKSRPVAEHFLPDLVPFLDPIVAQLIGLGLVQDKIDTTNANFRGETEIERSWRTTKFGVDVLEYLARQSPG
jgi:hypothetical protein